jgi:putrescine importer
VGLGLGYMTPTVVFDTFGIVSEKTDGVVPLAYVVALVVMLFTAISYGKMVQIFPSAGSAYVYTKETMSRHLGFLVGWASLLDYLLLPLVNAVIIRIYMVSIFPAVPHWIWVCVYVAGVTGINVWSMGQTSNLNKILVIYEIVLIAVLLVFAWIQLQHGVGQGTVFTLQPLFHEGVHMPAVFAGATVVAFSFIGFDAITMYTEEAIDDQAVPKAIILTVLIGGAIFFVGGYFAQSVFPNVADFHNTDDTLPEIALYVGGEVFKLVFLSAAFAATVASGLSSHASVSRLLYVMGRNGVLPKKLFGYVHPRFQTPAFDVILVGAVGLLAIGPSLELIASVINFGALIAFTFVNLSVIAHFAFQKKQYKTPHEIFSYIVMPAIGAGLTGVLWSYLSFDALFGGLVWLAIGIIWTAFITGFFRNPIPDMGAEEDAPTD